MTRVGGHSQMRNAVEKKLRLFKGCVVRLWQWCVVRVYACGGVGDNDRVHLFSSLFSLPLVDYVGVVTISRVNGGSVGPWMENIWLPSREWWVIVLSREMFVWSLSSPGRYNTFIQWRIGWWRGFTSPARCSRQSCYQDVSCESNVVCVDAHYRARLGRNNLTKVPEELWLFENLE